MRIKTDYFYSCVFRGQLRFFFFFFFVCTALIFFFFYTESKGNSSSAQKHTHNTIWALWYLYKACRVWTTHSKKKKKWHNVTLTLILNLHLMEQDPSVSCLPIFAGTKLLLIINSGAAVLKYMTYLLAY